MTSKICFQPTSVELHTCMPGRETTPSGGPTDISNSRRDLKQISLSFQSCSPFHFPLLINGNTISLAVQAGNLEINQQFFSVFILIFYSCCHFLNVDPCIPFSGFPCLCAPLNCSILLTFVSLILLISYFTFVAKSTFLSIDMYSYWSGQALFSVLTSFHTTYFVIFRNYLVFLTILLICLHIVLFNSGPHTY